MCIRDRAKTVWPSGLRRWLKAPVRKGVGSNPAAVTLHAVVQSSHPFACIRHQHRHAQPPKAETCTKTEDVAPWPHAMRAPRRVSACTLLRNSGARRGMRSGPRTFSRKHAGLQTLGRLKAFDVFVEIVDITGGRPNSIQKQTTVAFQ